MEERIQLRKTSPILGQMLCWNEVNNLIPEGGLHLPSLAGACKWLHE